MQSNCTLSPLGFPVFNIYTISLVMGITLGIAVVKITRLADYWSRQWLTTTLMAMRGIKGQYRVTRTTPQRQQGHYYG